MAKLRLIVSQLSLRLIALNCNACPVKRWQDVVHVRFLISAIEEFFSQLCVCETCPSPNDEEEDAFELSASICSRHLVRRN
jgi:hypothetical protein